MPPFDETSFRPCSVSAAGASGDPLLRIWRTDGETC